MEKFWFKPNSNHTTFFEVTGHILSMEHDLPVDANVLGCDLCGEKHDTNSCPLVKLVNHIEDKAIPSRARLSLPSNLYLQEHNGKLVSVCAGEDISKGTQFGPFEAPIVQALTCTSNFPLKVFDKDGTFVFLDTSIEQYCNWMCLIQPTDASDSQNLIAYQLNDGIYFTALRQITKDDELRVGYGAGYAKKMGLASNTAVSENSPKNCDDLNKIDTKQDTFEENDVVDDVRKLPASALGAKKDILDRDKTEWNCSQCEATFNNCVDFGYHLQNHVRPLMQIEKTFETKNKSEKLVSPLSHESMSFKQPEDSGPVQEVHLIISTVDPLKYNLRKHRKKSRVLLENEETSTPKPKKLKLSHHASFQPEEDEKSDADDEELHTGEQNEEPSSTLSDLDEVEENVVAVLAGGVNSDNISFNDCSSKSNDTYTCEICDKIFSKLKYLYRHLKKHTGAFSCTKCHKAFARNESLQLHSCISLISEGESKTLQYSCTFCEKVFGTTKLLERHIAKHTGEIKCIDCGRYYASQETFDAHECPTKMGEFFECNICLKKFSQKIYLTKHIPIHTGQFKCPICDKTLRSNESLQNHVRICGRVQEIETNGQVTCDVCSEIFTDSKTFRKHVYKHSHSYECEKCGARFRSSVSLGIHVCAPDSCRECGKTFNGVNKLEKHLLTSCGSQYACDKCLRPFQDEDALNQHDCPGVVDVDSPLRKGRRRQSTKKGTDKSPFICETCGCMFSSLSSLNVHRNLHGEKKFFCKICDKRFHRKDLMQEHESVHGEASIECLVCNKMFKTKKSLEVHSNIHRGVKRFKCKDCEKEFFQKGNLRKHLETHNPERRYECDVCNKNFSTKEYLKIHQLEHSQGKIHSCNICGRSFLKSHQLNHHQKIFHSNQSYVCRYCSQTMKLRHSLKRHLEKKHAALKSEWDNSEVISSMAVIGDEQNEQICTYTTDSRMEISVGEETTGSEILVAVAGIGSELLEKAIAEGKAQVKQGSMPNTIEISLPGGLEGEELTRSLVQNSNTIETVTMQEQTATDHNGLKLFNLHSDATHLANNMETHTIVNSDYITKGDETCTDLSKLIINTVNHADQLNTSTSNGIIVNFHDENAQQIIINQGEATGETEELGLTEEGPILLYVVTDGLEEQIIKN
ncbi:Zinc finger protein 26 [Nymphon striatum]|nr:Zinc finger protein 26 [Nymphon striatum]